MWLVWQDAKKSTGLLVSEEESTAAMGASPSAPSVISKDIVWVASAACVVLL